jgi:hypothetical protein
VGLELRRVPVEHDPVDAGKQAKRVPLIDPVALVATQRFADRAVGEHVVAHPLEQRHVEA